MANMEQKVVGSVSDKQKEAERYGHESDNLGLDADHSSEASEGQINLNNDNDMISHNPEGEDDDRDSHEEPGHSPLMDK